MPGCIHTVLVLADRDLALRIEKPTAVHVRLTFKTFFLFTLKEFLLAVDQNSNCDITKPYRNLNKSIIK